VVDNIEVVALTDKECSNLVGTLTLEGMAVDTFEEGEERTGSNKVVGDRAVACMAVAYKVVAYKVVHKGCKVVSTLECMVEACTEVHKTLEVKRCSLLFEFCWAGCQCLEVVD